MTDSCLQLRAWENKKAEKLRPNQGRRLCATDFRRRQKPKGKRAQARRRNRRPRRDRNAKGEPNQGSTRSTVSSDLAGERAIQGLLSPLTSAGPSDDPGYPRLCDPNRRQYPGYHVAQAPELAASYRAGAVNRVESTGPNAEREPAGVALGDADLLVAPRKFAVKPAGHCIPP